MGCLKAKGGKQNYCSPILNVEELQIHVNWRWVYVSRFYSLFVFSFVTWVFISCLYRWLALFLSLKAAYRLHHQRLFDLEEQGQEEAGDGEACRGKLQPGIKCLSRKDLILWLNRPISFPNMHNSPVLQVRNIKVQACWWQAVRKKFLSSHLQYTLMCGRNEKRQ